jgi:phosphoglycerate kinase
MMTLMKVVTAQDIKDARVLIRLDFDVPLKSSDQSETVYFEPNGSQNTKLIVADDTRLRAGLATLQLCLENAASVILMGHLGRPEGRVVPELSLAPVVEWFETNFKSSVQLPPGKLHLLENLRFEPGEDLPDLEFAKQLASMADFYINESFASHHPSASTTILPTLLPHAAGIRFAEEVSVLRGVRDNPQQPLVAVIGGAKIADKLPVVQALSRIAKYVLIGGKLVAEIRSQAMVLPENVIVAELDESGLDIDTPSIQTFTQMLKEAKQVVWSGPMGKFEDGHHAGTRGVAEAIIASDADSIIGGGDTITAVNNFGLLDKMNFVSTGGGAMLKLLAEGTLPTIEALQ